MSDQPLYYTIHPSTIGELLLVGDARGLHLIRLYEEGNDLPDAQRLDGFFASAAKAIDAFLTEGIELKLPIALTSGTPLQRAVWLALSRIPYGETVSYSQLAEKVGFPRAVRAVASACGANPLPLVIPCHRVVAKDGTLGGFSLGGIAIKDKLLALEGVKLAKAA
jgi:methylated-DNA-[protein]-cysteine S-methyltransferase